ncbi:MAG TPA: hypothetical protein VF807_13260 [Ktedonobacterales bacterium]
MAESALAKKLKIKPDQRIAIINAPADYIASLYPLPEGVTVADALDGTFTWMQTFVSTQAEVAAQLPQLVAALAPVSLLWLSFPKESSKLQTDLTRDIGWDAVRQTSLRWLTLISINETWSAFSLRPSRPGEPPQTFR